PHLFFLDFVSDAAAIGRLETEAVGGTWGKATSILARGIEPSNLLIDALLAPYTANINGDSRLMRSYINKYFNDMFEHARDLARVCARGGRLAYVIGNSRFFGHILPSDELLAAIFRHCGFALDRIDRMRR